MVYPDKETAEFSEVNRFETIHPDLGRNRNLRTFIMPAIVALAFIASACSADTEESTAQCVTEASTAEDQVIKQLRWKEISIISSFENCGLDPHYSYIENIGDKRGYSAGRAGLSGASSMLAVIERFSKLISDAENPHTIENPLAKYRNILVDINSQYEAAGSDIATIGIPDIGLIEGLEGIEEAWLEASESDDQLFNRAQDDIFNSLYLNSTVAFANELGFSSPLSELTLLDAAVQHGVDGMKAIAVQVTAAPSNERAWLTEFNQLRILMMEESELWKDTTDRVDALDSFLNSYNMNLAVPLSWVANGNIYTIDIDSLNGAKINSVDSMPSNDLSNFDFDYTKHTVKFKEYNDTYSTVWDSDTTSGQVHNRYFVALPFNDFDINGIIPGAREKLPWLNNVTAGESSIKGQWVKLTDEYGNKVYGQLLDAHGWDHKYVFGIDDPRAEVGILLSKDIIRELYQDNSDVTWTFVDRADVSDGPWLKHISLHGTTEFE